MYGGINSVQKLKENLMESCIPSEIVDMDYTRFEEFLSSRRLMMAKKIHDYYQLLR